MTHLLIRKAIKAEMATKNKRYSLFIDVLGTMVCPYKEKVVLAVLKVVLVEGTCTI